MACQTLVALGSSLKCCTEAPVVSPSGWGNVFARVLAPTPSSTWRSPPRWRIGSVGGAGFHVGQNFDRTEFVAPDGTVYCPYKSSLGLRHDARYGFATCADVDTLFSAASCPSESSVENIAAGGGGARFEGLADAANALAGGGPRVSDAALPASLPPRAHRLRRDDARPRGALRARHAPRLRLRRHRARRGGHRVRRRRDARAHLPAPLRRLAAADAAHPRPVPRSPSPTPAGRGRT